MPTVKDYFLKHAAQLDQEAVRIADCQLRADYYDFAQSLRNMAERVIFIDPAEIESDGAWTWMT